MEAPTQLDLFSGLISCTEASRSCAPICPSPVAAPGSPESVAGFGSRCFESSESYARAGASLRTFLLSALAELTSFSLVWRRQATPLGRSWWVLGRSERRTGESGFGSLLGLWMTPQVAAREGGPTLLEALGEWPTPTAETYGSSNNGCPGDGRTEYATRGKPSLEGMARQGWPTPTASDSKASGASGYSTESGRHQGTTLTDAIVGPRGPESRNTNGSPRGSLNPDWVETLMGAPPGWTDLPAEIVSEVWATRTRRTSPKSSGGGS